MLTKQATETVMENTVNVPEELKPVFDLAQKTVGDYFKKLKVSIIVTLSNRYSKNG